jgi:hypothetical protein
MKKLIKIVLLSFSTLIAIGVIASLGSASSATGTSITTVVEDTLSWDTQASSKAQQYLDYSAFSRSGLIDQLVFEGFDEAEATVAVDSLNVNWNLQAAQKAKDYLEYSSFSKSGLQDQLEFEGFTPSQASYGVASIG